MARYFYLVKRIKKEIMAYSYTNSKGQTYYLHFRIGSGRSKKGELYFFSRSSEGDDVMKDLPKGYEVRESERSGLPVLRKIR